MVWGLGMVRDRSGPSGDGALGTCGVTPNDQKLARMRLLRAGRRASHCSAAPLSTTLAGSGGGRTMSARGGPPTATPEIREKTVPKPPSSKCAAGVIGTKIWKKSPVGVWPPTARAAGSK